MDAIFDQLDAARLERRALCDASRPLAATLVGRT